MLQHRRKMVKILLEQRRFQRIQAKYVASPYGNAFVSRHDFIHRCLSSSSSMDPSSSPVEAATGEIADKYRRFKQRVKSRAQEKLDRIQQKKQAILASSSLLDTPWSAPLHDHIKTESATPSAPITGILEHVSVSINRLIAQVLDPTSLLENEAWRPMTAFERIQRFPLAMKALMDDWQQHQYIVDASNSPRNAWTQSRFVDAATDSSSKAAFSMLLPGSHQYNHGDDESIRENEARTFGKGVVLPWRQQVQKRQAVQDMSSMAGLSLLWIPPILGWIPTILAVVAPRQAYTRHFHSKFEAVQFAILEQNQRFDAFEAVLSSLCKGSEHLLDSYLKSFFSDETFDSTGPVLADPVGLYNALFEEWSPFHKSRLAGFIDLEELPVSYTQNLALAMGIGQSLPPSLYLNKILTKVLTPIPLLRNKLRCTLYELVEDDIHLVRDGHHLQGCASLTAEEIVNCCRVRNLPIVTVDGQDIFDGPQVVDYESMRRSLTNHLQIMDKISKVVTSQVQTQNPSARRELQSEMAKERLGLFAAHVSIIRHRYEQSKPPESTV